MTRAPRTGKHILLLALLLWIPQTLFADALLDIDGSKAKLVNPKIQQTEFSAASIDQESFELLGYGGLYSFENFDTRLIMGVKGSFHFKNRFFIDFDYGSSSVKGDFTTGNTTISVDETLTRYDAGIGFNLIEGRVFWQEGFALTNELYLKYSRGKVEINNAKNDFSSIGMGVRLLHPNDFLSLQAGFNKDSIESGNGLENSENLKFFAGIGIYF